MVWNEDWEGKHGTFVPHVSCMHKNSCKKTWGRIKHITIFGQCTGGMLHLLF